VWGFIIQPPPQRFGSGLESCPQAATEQSNRVSASTGFMAYPHACVDVPQSIPELLLLPDVAWRSQAGRLWLQPAFVTRLLLSLPNFRAFGHSRTSEAY